MAGISKLVAFDFSIEYKKGSENKAADALSKKPDAELLAISLLTPNDTLYQHIKDTWTQDATLQELIVKLQVQPFKYFTWCNDQLKWKVRLVVGHDTQLRNTIITLWHSTPQGGHSGMDATIRRIQSLFYWKSLVQDIRNFIHKCDVCQWHKYDVAAYPVVTTPAHSRRGVD